MEAEPFEAGDGRATSDFRDFVSEHYGVGANKSKTVTREKGERIVQVLKNDPAAASYDTKFKHWIRQ